MAVWSEIKTSLLRSHLGRMDAEYYRPESLYADQALKRISYLPLGQLASNGYRVVYENTKILPIEKIDYEQDCRFLQAANVSPDGLTIDVNEIGYVSVNDWNRYPKGRIQHGEILIEVKGKAEKVVVVQDYVPLRTLVSGSLFKLTLQKKSISPEYLFVYMNSYFGRILRDRTKVNTLISFVSKPELYRIPVYLPPQKEHKEITSFARTAFDNINKSKKKYAQASQLLEQEIGLDKLKFENPVGYEAKFSEVVNDNRADADYYQTKYRQIERHAKKINTTSLGSICKFLKGVEVGSKSYTETGKLFIRVSNITPNGITTGSSDKYISDKLYKTLGIFRPNVGDILLTKDGTVAMCYVVDETIEGIICSGILKLNLYSNKIPKEYLALAMNSKFCQMQAERDCSGALIMHWKPNEVRKLKIPILEAKKMQRLADMVTKSKKAKKEALSLLEQAKQRVEELIEQGVK